MKETKTDKRATYEQLIRALKRRNAEDTGSGYAAYLSEHLRGARDAYRNAVSDAYLQEARQAPAYGKQGESLARAGVGDSGYAAYLTERGAAAREQAVLAAGQSLLSAEDQTKSGYASYLAQRNQATLKLANTLLNRGVRDYDTAYAYALASGADETGAEIAARLSEQLRADSDPASLISLRVRILTRLVSLELPQDAAYNYALSCGVSEEVAEELARAASNALNNRWGNHYVPYQS